MPLKPRTQLLLYRLLWLSERMLRPTIRNALCSFDEWAYRDGLWRDIMRLEEQQLLTTSPDAPRMDRVIELTALGRKMALGGCHPPDRWNRGWDGKWRVVCFDIPETDRARRARLRRALRSVRFGAVQRSTWICPDPLGEFTEGLQSLLADCGVLMAVEGSTCLGETDTDMARAAWDFAAVEKAYAEWTNHARTLRAEGSRMTAMQLLAWGDRERHQWGKCLHVDPLLPRELWPEGYPGEDAWNMRLGILAEAAGMLV